MSYIPAKNPIPQTATEAELLTTAQVAALTQTSESYWEKLRWKGTGPSYIRIGRAVRYHIKDILEYLRSLKRKSTSEAETSQSEEETPQSEEETPQSDEAEPSGDDA